MTSYHYKCRAETIYDICKFFVWVVEKNRADGKTNVKLTNSRIDTLGIYEGIVWEFKSNLKHKEIINLMEKAEEEISDGLHIMYETLTYFEHYTGERDHGNNYDD